jgi:ribosomal protein S18 acetylase RimI-like enzyme
MTADYTVRRARLDDLDVLVDFTMHEAREAESKVLDPAAARRGVLAAFEEPPRASYWVAETTAGAVVASASIVLEWSDFHGQDYWWVQSLFISPAHRGRGLSEKLLDQLARSAEAAGALELRLYVHETNARALRAYHRLGFSTAPYVILRRSLNEHGQP